MHIYSFLLYLIGLGFLISLLKKERPDKTQQKTNMDLKINPEQLETSRQLNYQNTLNLPGLQKITDLPLITKLTIIYKIKPELMTDSP